MKFGYLAALSAACATVFCSSAAIGGNVPKLQGDKFSKLLSFKGDETTDPHFLGTSNAWFIRGWVNKTTKEASFQVYMTISYNGDFQGFERAADDEANDLHMEDIDKHIGSCTPTLLHSGCDLTETIGIDLPEAEMRARADTGLQIKVYAHSGDAAIITLSPDKVQQALLAANQALPSERKWIAGTSAALPENAHAPVAPVDFGDLAVSDVVTVTTSLPPDEAVQKIKDGLIADGWTVVKAQDGEVITSLRRTALSHDQADCGTSFGISWMADKRTVTITYLDFTVRDGAVSAKAAIAGKMDLGKMPFTNQDMGAKQLACRFRGVGFVAGEVSRLNLSN